MAIQKKQIVKTDPAEMRRYLIIGALVVVAFFGAYRFAQASKASAATPGGGGALSTAAAATGLGGSSSGGSSAAGGCCGGGSGTPTKGSAKVSGGVQKISVDASQGYNPNVIQLKAGVPAEITFSQSSGCTAIVQSSDLGFQEDLSAGPKTVKIKALQPGTYNFACGMNMVRGQIVVQ
jgi:plastocyanin